MPHPWDPEQTIEAQEALSLIRAQFPHIGAEKIRSLGSGWDNTAFLIDEALVFRFPRRHCALSFLEAEWALLPKIAPLLPAPIPLPEWRGEAGGAYPWPFIGYRLIEGRTLCAARLSDEEKKELIAPIAHFLKSLHALPLSLAHHPAPEVDNKARIDSHILARKTLKNFEDMEKIGLLENQKALISLVEQAATLRPPEATAIVHGDLYFSHILVNDTCGFAGVIDWGDIHVGDVAIDLSIAHSLFPPALYDFFRLSYGEVTEETWNLARLRAIFSSTLRVLFGYHSQNGDTLREGLHSLRLIGG